MQSKNRSSLIARPPSLLPFGPPKGAARCAAPRRTKKKPARGRPIFLHNAPKCAQAIGTGAPAPNGKGPPGRRTAAKPKQSEVEPKARFGTVYPRDACVLQHAGRAAEKRAAPFKPAGGRHGKPGRGGGDAGPKRPRRKRPFAARALGAPARRPAQGAAFFARGAPVGAKKACARRAQAV